MNQRESFDEAEFDAPPVVEDPVTSAEMSVSSVSIASCFYVSHNCFIMQLYI